MHVIIRTPYTHNLSWHMESRSLMPVLGGRQQVWCSVVAVLLQCCCSVLYCVAVCVLILNAFFGWETTGVLQCCCSIVTACYSVLQCAFWSLMPLFGMRQQVCCSIVAVLSQCGCSVVAVCCSVLQCCCSVVAVLLQCCCSVSLNLWCLYWMGDQRCAAVLLQCCCIVLRRVALCWVYVLITDASSGWETTGVLQCCCSVVAVCCSLVVAWYGVMGCSVVEVLLQSCCSVVAVSYSLVVGWYGVMGCSVIVVLNLPSPPCTPPLSARISSHPLHYTGPPFTEVLLRVVAKTIRENQ